MNAYVPWHPPHGCSQYMKKGTHPKSSPPASLATRQCAIGAGTAPEELDQSMIANVPPQGEELGPGQ